MAYSDLTPKQQRFCDEYLIDLNATQAAIRAGYSVKTANEQGSRLLVNVSIQKYLSYRHQQRLIRTEISQDSVLQEFAKIAFIDIRKFYNEEGKLKLPHQLDDNCAAALAGIDVDELWAERERVGVTKKIKLNSKIAALENLGKHIGIYKPIKIENNLSGNVSILNVDPLSIEDDPTDDGTT